MEREFLQWINWRNRNCLEGIKFPGVYTIALSEENISSMPFSWMAQIIYVGMTNAQGGLKSRLQQFDDTIKGKKGHSGAHRVRYRYPNYNDLVTRLYVSLKSYNCNVKDISPDNLRIMGEVAKEEYECFAIFVERYNQLPEFNNKKRLPKK